MVCWLFWYFFCLIFHLIYIFFCPILILPVVLYIPRYSAFIKVSSHSSLIPLSAIKVSDSQSLISIEKSLFFPLKNSRIMNEIYFYISHELSTGWDFYSLSEIGSRRNSLKIFRRKSNKLNRTWKTGGIKTDCNHRQEVFWP